MSSLTSPISVRSNLQSPLNGLQDFVNQHWSALVEKAPSLSGGCCGSGFPSPLRRLPRFSQLVDDLRLSRKASPVSSAESGSFAVTGIHICIRIEHVRLLDRFSHWQNRSGNHSASSTSLDASHSTAASGTLYLTPTHLIFVNPIEKRETWLLLGHIGSAERLPMMPAGFPLQVRGKTFFSLIFVVAKDRDCQELQAALQRLSQPSTYEELYCFSYNPSNENADRSFGWNLFEIQSEYQRFGVPNENWVLTRLNQNYEVCDTYPQHLYVPASANNRVLLGSAGFRSRGRLPVLTYLHNKTNAAICRCSQPLSGFNSRCEEDEELLSCILRSSPRSKCVYIIDTRPRINAMANRAAGKGYETEANYVGMKVQFFSIENIHVMRNSLQKLNEVSDLKAGADELLVPSYSMYLDGLQASGWLKHIKAILEAAAFVAERILEGNSVLVHCSDGWDRTAQTCSLACLILDPYYCTLHGFIALIEKEWLAFGHKFSDRAGHLRPYQLMGSNAATPSSSVLTPGSAMGFPIDNSREQSPVFTQFLDCVWQLWNQQPEAFQFNERFLLVLHDHLYSCQFGTLVGNCEKERRELRLSERTFSLWGHLRKHMNEYLNPLYDPRSTAEKPLRVDVSSQNLRLWIMMYNRFEEGVHPREPLLNMISTMKDHSSALEDHALFLEKRVAALKAALKNKQSAGKTVVNGGTSNHTGPLSPSSPSLDDIPNAAEIIRSVAVDWKSTRNVKFCICSTPFSQFSTKYHCWRCGDVVCRRCTEAHSPLLGMYSNKPVPVCQLCHDAVKREAAKQQQAEASQDGTLSQKDPSLTSVGPPEIRLLP